MPRIVPSPPTESPGLFQTSALFNAQVRDLNNFALGPPMFYGRQASAQSIPTSGAAITIDTEILDPDGFHSTVTNASRVTPNVPGTYLILGSGTFAANATGVRSARIFQNGTVLPASQTTFSTSPAGIQWGASCWAIAACNGTTDYVELNVSQTSGGALSTYIGVDVAPSIAVYFWSR